MQTVLPPPTVMILGSDHFTNPGVNAMNIKYDDILDPKRQRECEQLVQHIKEFKPTRTAITIDERFDVDIQAKYQKYLKGAYELTRRESEQIGFRVAKEMGHSKLYCVDYWPEHHPFFPDDFDWKLTNYIEFAKNHNQEHLLPRQPTEGKILQAKDGTTWIEPKKYETLMEMHKRLNHPEGAYAMHQLYLRIAQIGQGTDYPGANWVTHFWYARNLNIFVNLTRITESADDRILLIIGAGHIWILQQFLKDSGDYIIESPLSYLNT